MSADADLVNAATTDSLGLTGFAAAVGGPPWPDRGDEQAMASKNAVTATPGSSRFTRENATRRGDVGDTIAPSSTRISRSFAKAAKAGAPGPCTDRRSRDKLRHRLSMDR